jgi:hypothetical protein
MTLHALSQETLDCIDSCLTCHKMCLASAMTYCLEKGEEHVEPQHFRRMMDCAAMCMAAADFMSHKSQFHKQVCGLCAEICEACAEDCEKLDGMQDCADTCRACAASCRMMGR